MSLTRILKHLASPSWIVRRAFPPTVLRQIERTIARSERDHEGELRFVIEAGLDLRALLRGQSARARAIDIFSELRVWDTEHNSGILIYVQLIDRKVEVLADRGINARVPQEQWKELCGRMEQAFRRREFERGALDAIEQVTTLLRHHFPATAANVNELPDRPVVL